MAERIPLEQVDELRAPPVVGRLYLVPTVRHHWNDRLGTWPIMGPKHEDAEHLRFSVEHYHLDLRFLGRRQEHALLRIAEVVLDRRGVVERAARLAHICASMPVLQEWTDEPLPRPTYRVRRCYRTDHGYPLAHSIRPDANNQGFRDLHAAYAGRRCGRDADGRLICPHKGFPLDSLAPDTAGRVVCPLHGLVIDTRASVVVPVGEAADLPFAPAPPPPGNAPLTEGGARA